MTIHNNQKETRMKKTPVFLELHVLRNVPSANLNRDDNNQPKTAYFGDKLRSRISSQSIKRAIRTSHLFATGVGDNIGVRTKHLVRLVAEELSNAHGFSIEDANNLALVGLTDLGFGKITEKRTSVLVYIAKEHVRGIARYLAEQAEVIRALLADSPESKQDDDTKSSKGDKKKARDKKADSEKGGKTTKDERLVAIQKELTAILSSPKGSMKSVGSADIALFGRMLAEFPEINVDAACHVAHVISTNQLRSEFDFFTAVDDINEDDGTQGAGMMGMKGYNSACFYAYSVVDIPLLVENLGGDKTMALDGVDAYIRASVLAMPTGSQASTAAYVPPSFIHAVVRYGSAPLSLVNAFESPVRPTQDQSGERSLLENSVVRLCSHWKKVGSVFGSTTTKSFVIDLTTSSSESNAFKSEEVKSTFDDLLLSVRSAIADQLGV